MHSEALRDALVQAVLRDDVGTLGQLCRAYRGQIEGAFRGWKTIPKPLRADTAAVERYVAGLLGVARFFADALGSEALLADLTRGSGDPITAWQDRLQEAQEWITTLDYAGAEALLDELLEQTVELPGPQVQRWRAITWGLLGSARFNAGRADAATEAIEQALAHSEAGPDADREGQIAYLHNLFEVERYRGQGASAAARARQLAALLEDEDPKRARRLRVQAELCERGEPLLRVVVLAGDRALEQHELADHRQLDRNTLQFVFERNRVIPGLAAALTEQGRQAADEGRSEQALALFEQASRIDPYDPDPHFRAARVLTDLGRLEQALVAYEAVERLAPGWHSSREDAALITGLLAGELDPSIIRLLRELEQSKRPPRSRAALAEEALEHSPDLARLWLALGQARLSLGESEAAEAALREAVEQADNDAVLTRALAELGGICPDRTEGTRLLYRAVELRGDLVAAAMAEVMLSISRARAN